jgi:hypothetical protein
MSAHTFLPDMATADWHLPDPGNGGALPTSKCGIVPLVTAGAETRTLADPVRSGLFLTLAFKTDGGDCVITADSDVTATAGENVITFDTAGESITLFSIPVGSAFKWRVFGNQGGALS